MSAISSFYYTKTIGAGGTGSWILDLQRENCEGFFSWQLELTGDGTVKCEYLLSNNNVDFVDPEVDVFTGFTDASGPDADGKDLASFEPEVCRYLKFLITETGGADGVVAQSWICFQ